MNIEFIYIFDFIKLVEKDYFCFTKSLIQKLSKLSLNGMFQDTCYFAFVVPLNCS